MNGLKVFDADGFEVRLRCLNVSVTENPAKVEQVSALSKVVRCERVPKRVETESDIPNPEPIS